MSLSTKKPSKKKPLYVGRFAPSPTGPLHFGSLVAAMASYLDALAHQGQWLVRMEDIDPPREVPGAASQILATLENFGLQWHGSVRYQSERSDAYEAVLENLQENGLAYYCQCSRKQLAPFNGVYPGTCRQKALPNSDAALRLKLAATRIDFADALQGVQQIHLDQIGDFILKRRDSLYAYQLAVVVDDHDQQVSHIVRGIDLMDSTFRQIALMNTLGWQPPKYAHLPVIVNAQQQKLSKQSFAPAIDDLVGRKPDEKIKIVHQVLTCLGFRDVPETSELDKLLQWAVSHWRLDRLQGITSIPDPSSPNSSQ